jgi:hypothetical protein
LEEESGLALPLTPLPDASASEDVALYVAEAAPDTDVVLGKEHDRFIWLSLAEAVPRCLPSVVGIGLANAAAWLEGRSAI